MSRVYQNPARSSPLMPFGKFRGRPISTLDDDYLNWLAAPERVLRSPLRESVAAEVERRRNENNEGNEPADALLEQLSRLNETTAKILAALQPDSDAVSAKGGAA